MPSMGGGAGKKGINIAPPPTPQEILPPKPIIVAPMIIKKKRKRRKVAVYYSGPTMPTWEGQVPHQTTASQYGYANSLPLRKLLTYNQAPALQTVNFKTTNQSVPGYMQQLHADGETAKMSLHPFFSTELENQEGEHNLLEYDTNKSLLQRLQEKMDKLKEEIRGS